MKSFSAETVLWHASACTGPKLLSEISGEAELTAGMLKVLWSTPAAYCLGAMLSNMSLSLRHYQRVEPFASPSASMAIQIERILNRTTGEREFVARLDIAIENDVALMSVTADKTTVDVQVDYKSQDGVWDIVLSALPRVIFSRKFQR